MRSKFETVGEELLPVIAYGDGVGIAHDGSQPVKHGSIDGLEAVTQHPYFGRYGAGTWSDATHLSVAVTEGLIASEGFDLQTQKAAHIQAFNYIHGVSRGRKWSAPIVNRGSQTAWSDETMSSVERLISSGGIYGSKNSEARNSDVIKKMAPLVYWQTAETDYDLQDARGEQLIDFTIMTHDSPTAVSAALTHGAMLQLLLQSGKDELDPATAYLEVARAAVDFDHEYDRKNFATSDALERIADKVEKGTLTRGKLIDALGKKPSNDAPEVLLAAYGSFVLESTSPQSVYRAAELGGHASTTASIVNAMSLFRDGMPLQQPQDYNRLHDLGRLERASRQLTRLTLHQVA